MLMIWKRSIAQGISNMAIESRRQQHDAMDQNRIYTPKAF